MRIIFAANDRRAGMNGEESVITIHAINEFARRRRGWCADVTRDWRAGVTQDWHTDVTEVLDDDGDVGNGRRR